MTPGPAGGFASTGTRNHPGHDQKSHGRKGSGLTGDDALAAPPRDLAKLTEQGDSRAESLWYRTGDNSRETDHGRPGFVALNDYMRNREEYSEADPEMDRRIADIDSVMAESRLTTAIEVYRGVDVDHLGEPGELTGIEFTDRAFVSTSTDREHASGFNDGVVMRIHVPPGVAAVRGADRAEDIAEYGKGESEIILDRDLTFRVTGERETDEGLELDVEVVSR